MKLLIADDDRALSLLLSTRLRGKGWTVDIAHDSMQALMFAMRGIWLESEPGSGSTFHFTARVDVAATTHETSVGAADADLDGVRVLVVDDNATNRRILEQFLRGWRMAPTLAASGRDALTVLTEAQARGGDFPLILTDLHMPDMDGFSFVQAVRSMPALRGTTVLMLSSIRHAEEARRCRELDIELYLTKPVRRSHLPKAIRAALGTTEEHGNGVPREMVALFFEDYPKRVTEIRDALRAGDAQAMEFAAHALKGAAMTLCASRVVVAALELETASRAGDLESAAARLASLEVELVSARSALAGILGS